MADVGDLPVVIYDGNCGFCFDCVQWVKRQTEVVAVANQAINPADYGVTREQCEKSVVVINGGQIYFGAAAVAVLLSACGHWLGAWLLRISGGVGEVGYRYVASHRNGLLVRILHWYVKRY